MSKEIIHTNKAPESLAGYSQAVKSGGFVFVAGPRPFDSVTREVSGETIQDGPLITSLNGVADQAAF